MTKQYAERDAMALDEAGGYYMRHVMAMTGEQLHGKGDIAAELGWRDMQIAALQQKLDAVLAENVSLKKFCKNAAFDADYEAEIGMERGGFTDALNDIKTPDTDAIINEVRADAVQEAAEKLYGQGYVFEILTRFAAQLRAGSTEGGV